MSKLTILPNGRDVAIDPRAGDVAELRERPDRLIMLRFTDATGQECIHYAETKCITVAAWKRWMSRTGAYASKATRDGNVNVPVPVNREQAAEIFLRYGGVGASIEDLLRFRPSPSQLSDAVMVAERRGISHEVTSAAAGLLK